MTLSIDQRAQGCLVGLACGDAVGATVEFYLRGQFPPVTDMVGGGMFHLAKGQWTDDTAMALCLADSLLACQRFDAQDQMQRYLRWLYDGYNSSTGRAFGVGKQIARALFDFEETGIPYSQQTASHYSGNGSLMRLAPVILAYYRNPISLAHYAALSSQTTHASHECIQSCQYFAEVVRRALLGMPKTALFDDLSCKQFSYLTHLCQQDFCHKTADEINSSGYVVDCLEAALWAFWHTADFREAILMAVNLGGDADTAAAVCGQLAGAYYGYDAIPAHWLSALYRQSDIQHIAIQLIGLENES